MSLPSHLENLSKSQLENLCLNCGACCAPQFQLEKGVRAIIPDLRCKHLAFKSDENGPMSWCSAYEQRHEIAKGWCNSLPDAIANGLFPNECPYVKDLEGYNGVKILKSEQYDALRPLIKEAIMRKGKPEWLANDLWNEFLSK